MGGNELRYGSLFSGIGGIDLGMDMAGFECAWQVEIDDYCRQVLKEHWPEVPKYKDIYNVKGSEVEAVDILCGGFPCQPVSVAGKRGGVDDERWLWDEFYRLICELRPRWVVAENVTGLFSANSGRAFAGVLRDLAEGGYDAVWDVYPAGGPGGVGAPHRRERVFIVAHTNSSKQAEKSRDLGKELKVSSVHRQDISTVVSGGSSKNVANTSDNGRKASDGRGGKQVRGKRATSKVSRKSDAVADTNSKSKYGKSNSKNNKEVTRHKRQKTRHTNRKSSGKNVANTKRIRQQGSRSSRIWSSSEAYGKRETDNAFTIGVNNQWSVEPDVGRVANGVPRRVDRLRALGNGVVPQVAYKVARMIYEYTEKEK